jgi:CheY-like chemotaxis protein
MPAAERMAELLVVDDDADIAQLVELFLVGEGHRVRVAYDGEAGLSALRERLPDVVVMDIDMPILDGPGMAYRMLVEDCGKETIPIVIVSGNMNLPQIARRVGTPYTLSKPFGPAELVRLTDRALTERTPPCPPP